MQEPDRSFTDIALDSLQDIFYVVDIPDGRFIKWNRALAEKSGYSDEELSGMIVLDFYDEEGKQRQFEFLAGLLEKGQNTIEAEAITKDGRRVPFEFFATVVRAPASGEPAAIVGIGRDLTERRKDESALRKSEESLELILDSVPAMVFYKDRENRFLKVNKAFADAIGVTKSEIEGRTAWELFPKERADSHWKDDLEVIESGEPKRNTIEPLDTPRGTRWGRTDRTPLRDEPGNVTGVIGFTVDVTEVKEYEDALKESEERFRTIADNSFFGIVLHSGTELVYVNDKVEEITGYPKEFFSGAGELFDLVLPEYREILAGALEKLIQGEPIGEFRSVKLARKDGSTAEVVATWKLVNIGGAPAVLVMMFDVTEQRRIEEALRWSEERARMMSEEAERQARQLSDVVSIAAHELRHPATIFKGYADLLLESGGDLESEVIREALESIRKASDRLTQLVANLLETAKIGSERFTLECLETDPTLLVRKAVDLVQSEGATNQFRVELPDGEVAVRADPEKIIQAVRILLENAVKFSDEGSRIDVAVERSGADTVFSVADRGVGIPEDSLERVFDRFYQVEDMMHHSKEGMGLGLHIARSIVRAHGGWIKAEPRPGGGSVFTFGIPTGASETLAVLKVMVVDDDPEIVKLLGVQIRLFGHESVGICDGNEAVDAARRELPDAILLDLMMPETDGFQILEALKSSDETRDIPVLIISAKTEAGALERAMELGAALYVPKPFQVADVVRLVEDMLRERADGEPGDA